MQKTGGVRDSSQEEVSHSIIETVNVWLNVIDDDLRILEWNPMAERITGYLRRQVLGSAEVWKWLYPDVGYRGYVVERSKDILRRDRAIWDWETTIRCRNGEDRTIAWSSRLLRADAGGSHRAVTFGYDVTERRRSEERLKQANRDLSVLLRVASMTSASNEIRDVLSGALTPLLSAVGCAKGFVHLLDTAANVLKLEAAQGLSVTARAQLEAVPDDQPPLGQVLTGMEPVVIPDLGRALGRRSESGPDNLFHAYVGVPLVARGQACGVLSVLAPTDRAFTSQDLALLRSIGEQLGGAVENATLERQARQLAILEERRRLARDIHDSITQSLYSLTLLAEAGARRARAGDVSGAGRSLTRLGETANDALRAMRLLLYELRPLGLGRGEIARALRERLDAVERRLGIEAELSVEDAPRLPEEVERAMFGIAVEALNNAIQHANPRTIRVKLRSTDAVFSLTVEDDGHGFDADVTPAKPDHGLDNMRTRAREAGAVLQVHSSGGGTCVEVSVKGPWSGTGSVPSADVPLRRSPARTDP